MTMMTTLSLCMSCEFSRAIRILGRGGPHIFFLNRALLRLNLTTVLDVMYLVLLTVTPFDAFYSSSLIQAVR